MCDKINQPLSQNTISLLFYFYLERNLSLFAESYKNCTESESVGRWQRYQVAKQLTVEGLNQRRTSSQSHQPDKLQGQRLGQIFLHLCCLARHQPAGQRENPWYSRWLVRLWPSPVLSGQPGRTMENSLTREKRVCKMSSLSFTLIYHFTGLVLFSVCPAIASVHWCHF